jgi:DNA invertase Pin-like site-specific DNA recombinase
MQTSGASPLKAAAIYVRVSTVDQHVESQLYDLHEIASRRSFEVVKVYQDCGISGRRSRRPGLDALMADARQHKFAVVLVAAFDRVARSTRHFLQVIDELDKSNPDRRGPRGLCVQSHCAGRWPGDGQVVPTEPIP